MERNPYIDMLFGVFLFIGGMIAFLLIHRYLKSIENAGIPVERIILKPVEDNPSDNITGLLEDINNNIQNSYPKGEIRDIIVDITDKVKTLYDEKNQGLNWTSMTLTNIGSSPVYMAINKWYRPETPIYPGENIDIDFKQRGAIKKIYLLCDKGENTAVKIHAIK